MSVYRATMAATFLGAGILMSGSGNGSTLISIQYV
jgi:hypothetical protein